jgi:hypothetical protein
MAQQVSIFCSKTKLQQPTVEFEHAEGSNEPSCTCKVTLHAYFDAENDGFPEMTFHETARTKKASKGAAMKKASEFLSNTAVYKKVMLNAQVSSFVQLEGMLPHLCRYSSTALNQPHTVQQCAISIALIAVL